MAGVSPVRFNMGTEQPTSPQSTQPPQSPRGVDKTDERTQLLNLFISWLVNTSVASGTSKGSHGDLWQQFRYQFKSDGTMTWEEFFAFVQHHDRIAIKAAKIFGLLAGPDANHIWIREVHHARKEYERYISTDTRHLGLSSVRTHLEKVYGSLTSAWRKIFDQGCTNRCTHGVFMRACRLIGFQGDFKSIWADLSQGRAIATLEDLDPEGYSLLLRFYAAIRQKYQSTTEAWLAITHVYGQSGLQRHVWNKVCENMGFSPKEAQKLFLQFSICPTQVITLTDWKVLAIIENDPPEQLPGVPPGACPLKTVVSPRSRNGRFESADAPNSPGAGLPGAPQDPPKEKAPAKDLGPAVYDVVICLTDEEHEEYLRRLAAARIPDRRPEPPTKKSSGDPALEASDMNISADNAGGMSELEEEQPWF